MKLTKQFVLAAATAAMSILLSGCLSVTYKPKPQSCASYQDSERIPLAVELRMPDDYRKAIKKDKVFTIKHNFVYGEFLTLNTEECARAVFKTVLPTRASKEEPIASGAQAILAPRVTHFDIISPAWGCAGIVTTMGLECSLYDSTGKLIWVDTFKSECRGDVGGVSVTENLQRRFCAMFKDIFGQADKALRASPEIREYARKYSQPPPK